MAFFSLKSGGRRYTSTTYYTEVKTDINDNGTYDISSDLTALGVNPSSLSAENFILVVTAALGGGGNLEGWHSSGTGHPGISQYVPSTGNITLVDIRKYVKVTESSSIRYQLTVTIGLLN